MLGKMAHKRRSTTGERTSCAQAAPEKTKTSPSQPAASGAQQSRGISMQIHTATTQSPAGPLETDTEVARMDA
jgi:hypothetical protein